MTQPVDHKDCEEYRLDSKTEYWDQFALVVPRGRLVEVATFRAVEGLVLANSVAHLPSKRLNPHQTMNL